MTALGRRTLLKAGTGAAAVIAFDTLTRQWALASGGDRHASFARPPELDGTLLTGRSARAQVDHDLGNLITRTPLAVLQPGSVRDIVRMVRFCRAMGVKVAVRGQAHSTFGQGLTPGLLVESRWLDDIHSISPDGATVDPGVLWHDLIEAAAAEHLTPPAITGYTRLSVGGTLSVGGISSAYAAGSQADRVSELQVVTGRGDLVTCSRTERPKLFDAVRAGLGQCALVTRATVDLVPAPSMTRVYQLSYTDGGDFFHDLRRLVERGELDTAYGLVPVVGSSAVWVLNATAHFDPAPEPDDHRLLGGLRVAAAAVAVSDVPYLGGVFAVDQVYDAYREDGWDTLLKPWLDVWLPEQSVEAFVRTTVAGLGPDDVGATGFVLVIPHRRPDAGAPLLRLPRSSTSYLFDILTSSARPGPDRAFVRRMLARNRRLYRKAVAVGGKRYPIGSIPFDRADWVDHYGPTWPALVGAKKSYDPDNILTPGPGIFA